MKMKKIFIVFMLIIMTVLFVGCGKEKKLKISLDKSLGLNNILEKTKNHNNQTSYNAVIYEGNEDIMFKFSNEKKHLYGVGNEAGKEKIIIYNIVNNKRIEYTFNANEKIVNQGGLSNYKLNSFFYTKDDDKEKYVFYSTEEKKVLVELNFKELGEITQVDIELEKANLLEGEKDVYRVKHYNEKYFKEYFIMGGKIVNLSDLKLPALEKKLFNLENNKIFVFNDDGTTRDIIHLEYPIIKMSDSYDVYELNNKNLLIVYNVEFLVDQLTAKDNDLKYDYRYDDDRRGFIKYELYDYAKKTRKKLDLNILIFDSFNNKSKKYGDKVENVFYYFEIDDNGLVKTETRVMVADNKMSRFRKAEDRLNSFIYDSFFIVENRFLNFTQNVIIDNKGNVIQNVSAKRVFGDKAVLKSPLGHYQVYDIKENKIIYDNLFPIGHDNKYYTTDGKTIYIDHDGKIVVFDEQITGFVFHDIFKGFTATNKDATKKYIFTGKSFYYEFNATGKLTTQFLNKYIDKKEYLIRTYTIQDSGNYKIIATVDVFVK